MGSKHRDLTDASLHRPGVISATDPATTFGTGDTGVHPGLLWLEVGGDFDTFVSLKYRNEANSGWNTLPLAPSDALELTADNDGVTDPLLANNLLELTDSDTEQGADQVTGAVVFNSSDTGNVGAQAAVWSRSTVAGVGTLIFSTGSAGTIATRVEIGANGLEVAAGLHLLGPGDGDAATPDFAFANDLDTGVFRAAADELALSAGGTEGLRLTDSNLILPNIPTSDPSVTDAIWSDSGVLVFSGSTAGGGGLDNPGTAAAGALIYASALDTLAALAIGTDDQVLTVVSGAPAWADATGGSGLDNPGTAAAGSLIYASSLDTLAELAVGTNGQVLTVVSGAPAWSSPGGGGGVSNPGTVSTGDILYASASDTLAALGIGTSGQVLTVSAGGIPEWATASGGGGYTDGDTILAADGTSGAPGFAFDSDPNTGLQRPGSDQLAIICGGGTRMEIGTTIVANVQIRAPSGTASAPGFALGSDTNTGMYSSFGDILMFTAGGVRYCEMGFSNIRFFDEVRFDNGTEADPSVIFEGNQNSGWYRNGDGWSFSVNNVKAFSILQTNIFEFGQNIDNFTDFQLNSNRGSSDQALGIIRQYWNGNQVAQLRFRTGADTTNKDDGYIQLLTAEGGVLIEALTLAQDGGVIMPNLPTSDPVVAGELWNDSGTVKISAG